MRLRPDTIAIQLEQHGLFVSSIQAVEAASAQLTKRELARAIAACYADADRRRFTTTTYWMQYAAATLAIVYAGIYDPRDDYQRAAATPLVAPRPAAVVPGVTIEKHWDANVCETEHNGRVYVSGGRWQWIVIVDGVSHSAHDRQREAKAEAAKLTARAAEQIGGAR